MVYYFCPRCGYSCESKTNMVRHIQKKQICTLSDLDVQPILYQDIITRIPGSELKLLRKYIQQQEELKEKDKEIQRLKEQIKGDVNSHNNINSHNVNSNNNTVHINIHAYKEHDVEHLKDTDFKASLNRMIMCVPELVKRSHFNKDHPEYHNMYITNLRNNRVMAYDGEQWNVYNKNRLLNELIQNKELSIEEWLSIIEEKDPEAYEKYSKKYKNYEKLKDQEGVKKQIIEELELQLFNYKHIAQENNKVSDPKRVT